MSDLLICPIIAANTKIIARVDDTQDGDGGRIRVDIAVAAGSYSTVLKIDSLTGGRIRFDIAGEHGTWRTSAGTYTETISPGSAGTYVAIWFDPFTVAEIDYGGSSVEPV